MKISASSILLFFTALIISITGPLTLHAQENERAREIFEEVEERRNKVNYEQSVMNMTIYDSKGRTRNRVITSYQYAEGEQEKGLLVFEEPANVRGTAFLTLSEGSNEVQKLYLPALGRIQTITAAQQGDRFMGSDFTYEDLGDQNPDDYTFELISDSAAEAVIKAVKQEESQYAYVMFYVDLQKYVLNKAEYFNEEGKIIKRLEPENYVNLFENVWTANKMTMYDLREDRKTELTWSGRTINEPIPGWRFTERALRRGS